MIRRVWVGAEEPTLRDILNEILAFREEFLGRFERLFRQFDAMDARLAEWSRTRRFRKHYVHCKESLRQHL